MDRRGPCALRLRRGEGVAELHDQDLQLAVAHLEGPGLGLGTDHGVAGGPQVLSELLDGRLAAAAGQAGMSPTDLAKMGGAARGKDVDLSGLGGGMPGGLPGLGGGLPGLGGKKK